MRNIACAYKAKRPVQFQLIIMIYRLLQLCALICVTVVASSKELRIRVTEIKKITEDTNVLQLSFEQQLDDELVKLSGELKQLETIDDNWKVHITALKAQNADEEYHMLMQLPDVRVCDFMSSFYKLFLYDKLKLYSNAPAPENCPLASQEYYLKDYPIDSSQLQFDLIPGYYRILTTLSKADETKLELRLECYVE